ncbi:MAG: helix-turn-helix transcriptional regulator [Erysipelotrichaceae bacterium]|jgi:AcrR family transcriptional regulator|nr:helix-turn-helix transcriptional regulator [Erysipelotrichaceae bacterium]
MKAKNLESRISSVDTLIERKKEEKRKRLLDAAYTCFTEHTISGTSIAEICAEAGIAKGTFYLYFKDKEDIVRALNKRISYQVLCNIYHSHRKEDFVDHAVRMASELIHYFEKDHEVVALMKKDFVWPIDEEGFVTCDDPMMIDIRNDIDAYAAKSGLSSHQILVRVYALICMIYSVCYSSIIDHFPSELSQVKPEIDAMIRSSLAPSKKV